MEENPLYLSRKSAPNRGGEMREIRPGEGWARIRPEWVALVVTMDDRNGRPNIITLGWTMHASGDPPMAAIAVGKTRYSHELLTETGEFVLAYPNSRMGEAALFCGTHSGRDVDKFAETELEPVPAKYVRPPLIRGAVVNFECKVVGTADAGDHTVFLGRILAAYEEPGEKEILLNFGSTPSGKRYLTGITGYKGQY